MTELSHSPTDMPDRRAASRAASRASGRRPLRFHGPPDFIARPSYFGRNDDRPVLSGGSLADEGEGAVFCPRPRLFRNRVNKSLKVYSGIDSRHFAAFEAQREDAQIAVVAPS